MKLILLLSLSIPAVFSSQSCPAAINNPEHAFGTDMKFEGTHTALHAQAETAMANAVGVANFGRAPLATCAAPRENSLGAQRRYWWVKTCEPCRPNARHLWGFYGRNCFVIFPQWQQVRAARCSYRRCSRPCTTSVTKCLPTEWTRVWFYGWCRIKIGGWKQGLSYHYMYLPQDCTCHRKVTTRPTLNEPINVAT